MDCLRALIAALALVLLATAVPPAAAAQTPLEQLGQLSDQARAADEAHAEAAKICDREAMQRHLETLNRLAREARRVAEAARAAGEFATIDPENAARLAAIIATRARVAANRKPENCDERDASRREYFGKVEDTLTAMEAARLRGDCEEFRRLAEKAEYEISLERPIGYVDGEEAEALRRRLREMESRPCPPQQQPQQPPAQDPRGARLQQGRLPPAETQPQPDVQPQPELDQAQTANLEHARAANRCDPQEMQRRIEEVEAILSDLQSLLLRSRLVGIPTVNEQRQFEEVQKILEVMRARQAAPCPRHRMPRIEHSQQPQQQQQQRSRSTLPIPLPGPLNILGGGGQQEQEQGAQDNARTPLGDALNTLGGGNRQPESGPNVPNQNRPDASPGGNKDGKPVILKPRVVGSGASPPRTADGRPIVYHDPQIDDSIPPETTLDEIEREDQFEAERRRADARRAQPPTSAAPPGREPVTLPISMVDTIRLRQTADYLLDQATQAARRCDRAALEEAIRRLEALFEEARAGVRRFDERVDRGETTYWDPEYESAIRKQVEVDERLKKARALRASCPVPPPPRN